jgi:hypothetical protein
VVRFDEAAVKQANYAWVVDINIGAVETEPAQYNETASPAAEIGQPNQRSTAKAKSRERRRSSKADISGKSTLISNFSVSCHRQHVTAACSCVRRV